MNEDQSPNVFSPL